MQQIGGEIVDTIFGDQTPEVTPEVTPEEVPDDPIEGLARGRRTPTRSKKLDLQALARGGESFMNRRNI